MRDFDPTAAEFIEAGFHASKPVGKFGIAPKMYDPATVATTVGANVVGGLFADDAASTQANAANNATDLQAKIYEQQRKDNEPFRQAGLSAQNRLLTLLGLGDDPNAAGFGSLNKSFGMEDFQKDPGYQFRMDEGVKALQRGAAGAGRFGSGRYMKDLTRFGQDNASNEYQNAFNRFQVNRSNTLNPLQAFTGQGQSATNTLGAYGSNFATNAGNNMMGAGNALAAGRVAMGNAITNGASQYANNQFQNQLLSRLNPPNNMAMLNGGGFSNTPAYLTQWGND